MNLNKLLLNPSKTEFLLIGTKQQRLRFSDFTNLSLSNYIISLLAILASSLTLAFLSLVKSNLYPYRDQLSFSHPRHLSNSSSSSFLQPQLLQTHLSQANGTTVIHYTLASNKQISTNFNAVKTHWHAPFTSTSKYQHITLILKNLHWLPIKQRID